jgi:geranylgeranyl pyrophosphate synthase
MFELGLGAISVWQLNTRKHTHVQAAILLASLNSTEVVSIMSQILDDLVSGEFMQLQNKVCTLEHYRPLIYWPC